jgi:hypothetical protein
MFKAINECDGDVKPADNSIGSISLSGELSGL